ncbi:hypothetical protein BJX65DRAFT_302086 [Aspergillus insuetus]
MSVDMDFLFPLDERSNPLPETLSLNWPRLETNALSDVPENIPSGEWPFDYELSPDDEEVFPDPATGDEIFESWWLREEYEISREKMKPEHLLRAFISLGYASRQMPIFKLLSFNLASSLRTVLTFTTSPGVIDLDPSCTPPSTTRPLLHFRSDSGYQPDRRVADAWGFALDDMDVLDEGPRRIII